MPIPDHIDPDVLEQLPDSAGVYYFYDRDGAIIYIGKSINIRQRVRSHFYASARDNKEKKLALATHTVSHTSTPGELSALLLESRAIKQHNPLFNRRLRRHRGLYSWTLQADADSLMPTLLPAQWPPDNSTPSYGLYRNRSQAKTALLDLADKQQLCRKQLGLEASRRGCFNLQLKRCRGACIGLEAIADHNQRLQEALSEHGDLSWPYPGAIAIRESEEDVLSVFNQWYFLGEARDIDQAQALTGNGDQQLLDRDSYRILLHFLHNKDWQQAITVLANSSSPVRD